VLSLAPDADGDSYTLSVRKR